jgi:hypothetical protein
MRLRVDENDRLEFFGFRVMLEVGGKTFPSQELRFDRK